MIMGNKLFKFEVTYETKEIFGVCKHKQFVLADSAENAGMLLKARVKRLDNKRAYKVKAKIIKDLSEF